MSAEQKATSLSTPPGAVMGRLIASCPGGLGAAVALSFMACAGVVLALAASPALAVRGHEFSGFFGGPGAGAGQFGSTIAGLAVAESSHEVYVVDTLNHRVEVFDGEGHFLSQFDGSGTFAGEEGRKAPEALLEPRAIAVDNSCVQLRLGKAACEEQDPSNGDVYVQDSGPNHEGVPSHQAIDKFSASGAFIEVVEKSPETKESTQLEYRGVAVDRHGALWVQEEAGLFHHGIDDYGNGRESAGANKWHAFRTITPPNGRFAVSGFAVDSKDNLYVWTNGGDEGDVVEFNAKGEVLNEALDSEFPAVARFGVASEAKTDDVYINNIGTVGRFEPLSAGTAREVERFGAGFLTVASPTNYRSGVAVDSASETVYVADSATSRVAVFAPEEPKPPTIENESVSEVSAGSASLQAEINPRGAITEYHFEYGQCGTPGTCAESPYEEQVPAAGQPEGILGAALDFETRPVSAHPQDLRAGRTYHFRVLAHNEKNNAGEVVAGEEKVFSTQPAESPGLPDGRAWELVSPAQKHGTLIQPISGEDVIEASVAGNALAYVADSPIEAQPQGYSNSVSVLSVRGPGGWSSRDLQLPNERATGQVVGGGQEYHLFSEDLSRAGVQPFGAFNPAISAEASEQTPYLRTDFLNGNPAEPCTSGCLTPLVKSAPNRFGEAGNCPPHPVCGPLVVGASGDARHVVVESSVGLSEAAGDKGGLYEWSEGGLLQLVSVLPDRKPAQLHVKLGSSYVARNAVSADGRRVVFSAEVGGEAHLYLRDTATEETKELDEGLSGTPSFQTASADGRRVFFSENGEIYLYEAEAGKAKALTSGAEAQGIAVGASEDGSYIYFVGNGALAGVQGAVKGNCLLAPGAFAQCNLYELHEAAGEWSARLVAVLSGEDVPDFSPKLPQLTARVSPDGTHLAFMSQRSLTGYDNRDASSGRRDEEVYEFDGHSGRLICASCDPTGARPAGVEFKRLDEGLVAGPHVWSASTWLAGNVPGWTSYETGVALYQSRYLANSGRLFFNASDALVPQDVNGTEDVYQFEPAGVGGCSAARPTYSPSSAGCVDLISSGKSREESAFLDASQTGGDVFFLTASQLVKADFDTALDVYDAHECSLTGGCIPETAEPPPPCTSEASCKASPTPQPDIFAAPGSALFTGPGNLTPTLFTPPPAKHKTAAQIRAEHLKAALKACRRKHNKHKRQTCERHAHKAFGAARRVKR